MTTPHRSAPKPRRFGRILLWTFAALAAITSLTFTIIYVTLLRDLPPVSQAETRLVRPTSRILDRNGRLLYEMMDPEAGKQVNLDLSAIPAACVEATLSTEDSRFYVHPGVDPIAIGRAFWQNVRAERGIASGASTLTQQLARSLLLPQEERYVQSYARKIREAWLAFQLERRYTKDQLLALYLNQTYFGNFAFGLEAAGQNFFGKPAAQLSRGECALLVGLIQYPTGYNPLLDPDAAKGRQLTVLRLMQESGYLSADEAQLVAEEPLGYRSNLFEIQAPHFVVYVQDLLARRLGAGPAAGWRVDGHDDPGFGLAGRGRGVGRLSAGPAQLPHPRRVRGDRGPQPAGGERGRGGAGRPKRPDSGYGGQPELF